MPVLRPTYRDLSDLTVIESCKTQCWEICVPDKEGLSWSVVLSSLMQSVHADKCGDFETVLRRISGNTCKVTEPMKQRINRYNPFLNRDSCFFDGDLESLTHSFSRRIQRIAKELDCDSNKRSKKTSKNFSRHFVSVNEIRAICNSLKCRVTIIVEADGGDSITRHSESLNDPVVSTWDPDGAKGQYDVVLYTKRKEDKIQSVSFGIPKSIGSQLQKEAISKILRMSKIGRNAQIPLNLCEENRNFIHSAMQKPELLNSVLLPILTQPEYVLDKLLGAGIAILPTADCCDCISYKVKDTKRRKFYCNPFFHALEMKNIKLLYSLYQCAINSAAIREGCEGDRNELTKRKLKEVTNILTQMQEFYDTVSHTNTSASHCVHLRELISLNDFVNHVCELLMAKKCDLLDDCFSAIVEVKNSESVVAKILRLYAQHFYMGMRIPSESDEYLLGCYTHYVDFRYFFAKLDCVASLLILDRTFALNNRSKLEDNIHKWIKPLFMKFIFARFTYEDLGSEYEKLHPSGATEPSTTVGPRTVNRANNRENYSNPYLLLAYLERIEFQQCMRKVEEIFDLPGSKVKLKQNKKARDKLAAELKSVLAIPEIGEELLVHRLQTYMEAALRTKVEEKFECLLILQRTFQVLGESIKLEHSEKCTVAKSLFASRLHGLDDRDIQCICDKLDKLKFENVCSKIQMKENTVILTGVKNDLKTIYDALGQVFELQILRNTEYVHRNAVDSLLKWQKCPTNDKPKAEEKIGKQLLLSNTREAHCALSENLRLESHKRIEPNILYSLNNRKLSISKSLAFIRKISIEKKDYVQKYLLEQLPLYEVHFKNHFSRVSILSHGNLNDKDVTDRIRATFSAISVLLEFFIENAEFGNNLVRSRYEIEYAQLARIPATDKLRDIQMITNACETYRSFQVKLFSAMPRRNGVETGARYERFVSLKHLPTLHRILSGKVHVSPSTKALILSSVPDIYVEHHKALVRMIESLRSSESMRDADVEELLACLLARPKRRKAIAKAFNEKNIEKLRSFDDYYRKLVDGLETGSMNEEDYEYIQRNFEFPEWILTDLRRILTSKQVSTKINALSLFVRTVKLMENVFTVFCSDFKNWRRIHSKKTKAYVKSKLVSQYLTNPAFRACIETLLYDCTVLFKGRDTDLVLLWDRVNSHFNGVSLRNFLSSCHQLFDPVSKMLHPYDLPNVTISKALDFVYDVDVLKDLETLNDRTGCDLDNIGDYVKGAHKPRKGSNELYDLCKRIAACEKWKDYVYLVM